jgi:2-polyprenyl-3-methyl-5-hydroxy-6-metoxy-1,4-benzoquinol methylase
MLLCCLIPCCVQPRSEVYRDALTRNPGLLKGARLLDVGCGTSILCLFGAQGGAASVVGLDGSARIANCARQVRGRASFTT